MNIVFLDAATMGDVSFAPIEEHGTLTCYSNSTPEEAKERVKDCEILIINKIKVTPELIDSAPRLKLILTYNSYYTYNTWLYMINDSCPTLFFPT